MTNCKWCGGFITKDLYCVKCDEFVNDSGTPLSLTEGEFNE